MRHILLKTLRYASIPIVTAGLLAFFFSRDDNSTGARFKALAQGVSSLQATQSFTGTGTGSVIGNGPTLSGGPQGSVGFRMVYYIEAGTGTVSALSLELDGAATSGGSYTALTPAVGGGSGSGNTTNPVTSHPQGQNNLCCDFYPFLQIKVNTFTVASGAPVLIVKVLGYAGTTAAAGSSGGGGSGITCLTGDVDALTGSCATATVVGIDGVPLCSGFTPTNGQVLQYTTGSSPNPCYTAAAASGGGLNQLTGDVTAGPGTGSQAATVVNLSSVTNASLKNSGLVNASMTINGTSCTLGASCSPSGGGGGSGSGLTVYSGLAGISLSGATVYFAVGGGSLASATEASVQTFQGVAGTVSGFGANISAALGTTLAANNSVVLTWDKNGGPQAVTCTITNPATTCSDTTHSFTFSAADALDIKAVFTGTISAAPIWVMDAGISAGASGVHGTAVFSATGGTISGLVTTGCITGVTYGGSTGQYLVTVSGCPTNYVVATGVGDTAQVASLQVDPAASYSSTGFTLQGISGNNVYDPALIFITIP
jgi:hypothetical protein